MTKNNNFHEYVYPVIILTIIAMVATLLLAVTNSISTPIIERNSAAAADAARKEVLADADSFSQVEVAEYAQANGGSAAVTEVFKADNEAGYVMTVHTNSFGGDLTMMVGIDASGAVTGVKVTEHADTPGVGTKDQDADYLAQYDGKTALTSEDVKKEDGFEYISGASVSGDAIHKGVYAALTQLADLGGAQ